MSRMLWFLTRWITVWRAQCWLLWSTSLVLCEGGMEMRMSCKRSFRGVLEVDSQTMIPDGSCREGEVGWCEGAWTISSCPSAPFLSNGGKYVGVMRGLIMLVGGLTGEKAFVKADHMPPLPLELMVMLE